MRQTSLFAYANSGDLRAHHSQIILDTLERANRPLIAEQIALLSGLEYNQVSRRMKELENDNKVECTDLTGLTSKGRKAFKWQLKF